MSSMCGSQRQDRSVHMVITQLNGQVEREREGQSRPQQREQPCKGNSKVHQDTVVTLGKGGDPKVSHIAQSERTSYYKPGQGRGSKENEGKDPSLPQETTYRC